VAVAVPKLALEAEPSSPGQPLKQVGLQLNQWLQQ
jgi:hypothetical protein